MKDRTLVLSYTYTKIGTWKYETGKTLNVSLSFQVDQVSIRLAAAPGNMQFNSDMEFVKNFTQPDFQAKNFTPSISPNFNSFSKKKLKK